MEENKSLNKKYQSISEEPLQETSQNKPKPVKEEKIKEPKPPKEKKVKEPKPPKEKKVKEPKPPKEKKVKEPKPPKEKKVKEPKPPKEKKFFVKKEKEEIAEAVETVSETPATEIPHVAENTTPEETAESRKEEYVLPVVKSVKKISADNDGKERKKAKEPKPAKAKKEKESKPPKQKKEKAEKPKKEKIPKPPKEKKVKEPLTKKDFITIGFAAAALILALSFAVTKFNQTRDNPRVDTSESTTVEAEDSKLADIQIARDAVVHNIVQSDIPDVFFGFSTDYKLQYYQYHSNSMNAVKSTATVSASVDLGNETIPVTVDYVTVGDKIFGMGVFRADRHEDKFFYDMVVFKLVNLPEGYNSDGKALLLATKNKNALSQSEINWTESFIVDLTTGKTSRFLRVVNRTIDMNGAGVDDFCILTKQGYNSKSGAIPFITSREYPVDSGKQDIFIKKDNKETLYVGDIYGKFLLTDGNDIVFLRRNAAGFDAIRKSGEEETVIKTFYGKMSEDYMLTDNYLFSKDDGKLYNLLTGEEKLVVGYRMSPEMIKVSPDGKYLVMLGTVMNMIDYQVHIFNLETGEYAKYTDENYSSHSNLTFINDTTAVYVVLDPNQCYECVVLDVTKAVK